MNTSAMTKMKHIRRIILHHADFDFKGYPIVTMEDPHKVVEAGIASVVDEIDRWHLERWRTGLGYHFLIGNGHGIPDGYTAIGRPLKYQGVHAKSHNHDSIGILVVGDLTKHDPTNRQIEATAKLCSLMCFAYGLKPDGEYSRHRFGKLQKGMVISGHHDWPRHKSNSCPARLDNFIPGIRLEASAILFSELMALAYTPR